jgi:AraC-like DNA-binding protein/DNA-binding LacI/PurR family transcriptional regulator
MPPICKIAFVSAIVSAYTHRLLRGALSYAETHAGLMIQEFRVPRGLRPQADGRDPVSKLLAWQPDGLLSFMEDEELDQCLDFLGRPCPVVSMCHIRTRPGVVKVSGSFPAQAKAAVEHFRQQGLRSIAMLRLANLDPKQAQDFLNITRSISGVQPIFVEVLDPVRLDDQELSVEPVSQEMATWFRRLPKPSGVFCAEMGGGGYAIRVCQALGLRVPEDIAVIGSDDADVSLASHPTLTSVIPVGEGIGVEAVRVLTQMMSGKPITQGIVLSEAMDLRVRQSTGLQCAHVCDIAAAVDHIAQHACGGLTVEQLHKATQQVSYNTFHAHFKAVTGMTPGQAIQRRQIEEARRLLADTRLAVTTVAEKCGFSSSSDFARRFRAFEGITPSEYRQRDEAKSS